MSYLRLLWHRLRAHTVVPETFLGYPSTGPPSIEWWCKTCDRGWTQ